MADPVLAMPPQAEEKRWSLGDVLLIVVMYAVALTVGMLIALGIARVRGVASAAVLADPIWLFPVQLFGYVVALLCARVLVSLKTGKAFFASIGWNYPGGERLPQLLLLGLLLTIGISVISSFLPSPPDLPVMKMMATRRLALTTMLFATLFAPFAEEIFFRGIFYGALRWSLERDRTRTAIGIVLLALAGVSAIVAWRGAGSGYVLFAAVLLVIGGLLFPFREENAPLLDDQRQTAIAIVVTSLLCLRTRHAARQLLGADLGHLHRRLGAHRRARPPGFRGRQLAGAHRLQRHAVSGDVGRHPGLHQTGLIPRKR